MNNKQKQAVAAWNRLPERDRKKAISDLRDHAVENRERVTMMKAALNNKPDAPKLNEEERATLTVAVKWYEADARQHERAAALLEAFTEEK